MDLVTTKYGNRKQIIKFTDHYVNLAITVDDTGVVANAEGKKIVPAGTIMGGGVLASETVKATAVNGAGSEGVLFNDVDVTRGPAPGALLIHGFVALDKIPAAPVAAAVTALKQITFLK
ncbi:hypothetical protein ACIOBL_01470 [Paenibacillus taichungensis]|uniref:hypothetical protein n=1 Tax=Paenibacillus taichungensis TaxID=484184 RepID=UPI00382BD8E6